MLSYDLGHKSFNVSGNLSDAAFSFSLFMYGLFFPFRWNSCKQNKQGANSCTTNQNQTPSPEGEKLHSDSGISVDSQSLQEAQSQTQTGNTTTPAPKRSLNTEVYNVIYQSVRFEKGQRHISNVKLMCVKVNIFPLIPKCAC